MDQITDIIQQGHLNESIKCKTDTLLHFFNFVILKIKVKSKMLQFNPC